LLNTGGIGEIREADEGGNRIVKQAVLRVEIPEMASIIRGICRGSIEWENEPYFGTMIPKKVDGLDMTKFDLHKFYSQEQIDDYVSKLKEERIKWLERFSGLNAAIKAAVEQRTM
jgi:phosphoenolpyruvate carboxykinase (ATP)